MRRNAKLGIGVGIIVIALAYLMFTGFTKGARYFYYVGELLAQAEDIYDKPVKVTGDVVGETIDYRVADLRLQFDITDGARRLTIVHKGLRPDNLEGGRQVIAEGRLRSDGVFEASQILVQCPSKYEAKEKE